MYLTTYFFHWQQNVQVGSVIYLPPGLGSVTRITDRQTRIQEIFADPRHYRIHSTDFFHWQQNIQVGRIRNLFCLQD
jgi:hypothetical protein